MSTLTAIVLLSVAGPIVGSAIGVIRRPTDTYVYGMFVGATAGLMIYITTDELITQSCAGEDHRTIFALLSGIVFVIRLGQI